MRRTGRSARTPPCPQCGSRPSARKVNGKGASLVIEASEPVSYVASRPDPLTLLLDFRNVGAEGVANSVAANAKSPIASCRDRSGGVARRAGVARPDCARAAGDPPCPERPQYGRHRFRAGLRPSAPYVLPPAAQRLDRRRTRCRRWSRSRIACDRSRRSAWPDACAGAAGFGAHVAPAMALAQRRGAPARCAQRRRTRQQPAPAARAGAAGNRDAPRRRARVHRHIRSASTSRAPTCARCCAPSPRSAASTSSSIRRSRAPSTSRCATCRGIRRSTSSCKANKLGYIVDGTIVRIAPLDRARRRGSAAPQADRGAGARRRAAGADAAAELRQGRRPRAAAHQQRAVAARRGAGRRAHQHADHHATCPIG